MVPRSMTSERAGSAATTNRSAEWRRPRVSESKKLEYSIQEGARIPHGHRRRHKEGYSKPQNTKDVTELGLQ
jgi:hypothetical protein